MDHGSIKAFLQDQCYFYGLIYTVRNLFIALVPFPAGNLLHHNTPEWVGP